MADGFLYPEDCKLLRQSGHDPLSSIQPFCMMYLFSVCVSQGLQQSQPNVASFEGQGDRQLKLPSVCANDFPSRF